MVTLADYLMSLHFIIADKDVMYPTLQIKLIHFVKVLCKRQRHGAFLKVQPAGF